MCWCYDSFSDDDRLQSVLQSLSGQSDAAAAQLEVMKFERELQSVSERIAQAADDISSVKRDVREVKSMCGETSAQLHAVMSRLPDDPDSKLQAAGSVHYTPRITSEVTGLRSEVQTLVEQSLAGQRAQIAELSEFSRESALTATTDIAAMRHSVAVLSVQLDEATSEIAVSGDFLVS